MRKKTSLLALMLFPFRCHRFQLLSRKCITIINFCYRENDQHWQGLTTAYGSLYRPTQRYTSFSRSSSLVSSNYREGEIAITSSPERASAGNDSAQFRGVFRELRWYGHFSSVHLTRKRLYNSRTQMWLGERPWLRGPIIVSKHRADQISKESLRLYCWGNV